MGLFSKTKIHNIINLKAEKMLRTKEQKEKFEKALSLYHQKDYHHALLLFEEIDDVESTYYIAKCRINDYKRKYNQEENFELIKYCAENEYVHAFVDLADLYFQGKGTNQDIDSAIYWYKKGVQNNCPKSEFILGYQYIDGKYIHKNIEKGLSLIEKAASQNQIDALFVLGVYYDNGYLVEKNRQKATEYYEKAANLNHIESQARFAYALENGLGIEKNIHHAIIYYQKAADKKQVNALYRLGKIYKSGKDVPYDIKKASEYLMEAANLKHVGAMIEVAKMYIDGTYENNGKSAIDWYLKALEEKCNHHQIKEIYYGLIKIYLDFKCKQFNIYKAKEYYKKLSDLNDERVKEFDNKIIEIDKQAREFFNNALKSEKEGNIDQLIENYTYAGYSGISDAYVYLGKNFETGKLYSHNYEQALKYYKLGQDCGNPWAYECIGHLYYHGLGVEKNIDEAIKYYKYACDHDCIESLEIIIDYYMSKLNYNKAYEYKMKLADAGNMYRNANACFEVADYYEKNAKDEHALEISKKYYLKAIELGDYRAILRKYNEYCHTYEEKKKYLEKAALCSGEGAYQLYLLMKNHNVDHLHAEKYLYKAADNKYAEACYIVGNRYYENQDYNNAITYFELSPNSKASYKLSRMYRDGLYVQKDRMKANLWLQKLFKCNDKTKEETIIALNEFIYDQQQNPNNWSEVVEIFIDAINALIEYDIYDERYLDQILLYSNEHSLKLAGLYNFKMAELGYTEAEYRYGLACYENTYSKEKNHNDAYKYLTRAAEKNHVDAMVSLADVIFNGTKEIDYEEAKRKYNKEINEMVAPKYYNSAAKALNRYQNKDNIEKDIDDIIMDNRAFGNIDTLKYDLNQLVRNTEKLANEAIEYDKQYLKEKEAQFLLTQYKYFEAYNNKFNYQEGMMWLQKAAKLNHVVAMMSLGLIYIESDDRKKRKEGLDWLKKASDSKDKEAIELYNQYIHKIW